MGREKINNNDLSECCDAPVRMEAGLPDFIGDKNPRISTCWYICTKCNLPCSVKGYQPSRSLVPVNLSQDRGELVNNSTYIIPDQSATITSVGNGFMVEYLEELISDKEIHQYQNIKNVFETPEMEVDDLEAFQRLVWFLRDYFGIESGTNRRLDIEIYDPDRQFEKIKKGKK